MNDFPKGVRVEGLNKSGIGIYLPVQTCQRQVQTSFSRIEIVLTDELLKYYDAIIIFVHIHILSTNYFLEIKVSKV